MVIMQQSDQMFLIGDHSVKLGENRITFDPCPHIKSPFEIHVYAYKWLKTSWTLIG